MILRDKKSLLGTLVRMSLIFGLVFIFISTSMHSMLAMDSEKQTTGHIQDVTRTSGNDDCIIAGYALYNGSESGIVDMEVNLYDATSQQDFDSDSMVDPVAMTTTDFFGFYEFVDVVTGDYWVTIAKDWYLESHEYVSVGSGDVETIMMDIEPNGTELPSVLAGYVVDIDTGAGVPDASIDIAGSTYFTDKEGQFTILNLPPGNYTASATKQKYTTDTRSSIIIDRDYLTKQDFLISTSPGSVSGMVTLSNYEEFNMTFTSHITEVTVVMIGYDDDSVLGPFETETDYEGKFTIEDIPAGQYQIYCDEYFLEKGNDVVIVMPEETTDITLNVAIALTEITFEIDAPIKSGPMYVEVWPLRIDSHLPAYWSDTMEFNGYPPKRVQIEDGFGTITVSDIPAGDNGLWVTTYNGSPGHERYRGGFEDYYVELIIDPNGSTVHEAIMKPKISEEPKNVTVRLKDWHIGYDSRYENSQSVDEGTLTILSATNNNTVYFEPNRDDYLWEWIITDERYFPQEPIELNEEGQYTLVGLPSGDYTYRLEVPGKVDKTFSDSDNLLDEVWDVTGEHSEYELYVYNAFKGKMAVYCNEEEPWRIPWTIDLQGPTTRSGSYPPPVGSCPEGDGGNFFTDLVPGEYTVTVTHPFYVTQSKTITVYDEQYFHEHKQEIVGGLDWVETYAQKLYFQNTTIRPEMLCDITLKGFYWNEYMQRYDPGKARATWTPQYYPPSETTGCIYQGDTSQEEYYDIMRLCVGKLFTGYEWISISGDTTVSIYYDHPDHPPPTVHEEFTNGIVLNEDGGINSGAIPGAKLTIDDGNHVEVYTDESGYYETFYLSDDSKPSSWVYSKPGYTSSDNYILSNNPAFLNITVLYNGTSDPIEEVEITMDRAYYSGVTDDQGACSFQDLEGGLYTIYFKKWAYKTVEKQLQIELGDRKDLTINMDPIPPPTITGLNVGCEGNIFVKGIDAILELTATIQLGDAEDPITYVEFGFEENSYKQKVFNISKDGKWRCNFNLGKVNTYLPTLNFEVKAMTHFGMSDRYVDTAEYKFIECPSWVTAIDDFLKEHGLTHDHSTSLYKTRLWSNISAGIDTDNYMSYNFSVGYEFGLEINLQRILTNMMGFTDSDGILNGVIFKIEFFAIFRSHGNVTGGGYAELETKWPMGKVEVAPHSDPDKTVEGALTKAKKNYVGLTVHAKYVEDSYEDAIQITEVHIAGGLNQKISVSIGLKDLIEWVGLVLAGKTLGLATLASKVVSKLSDWLVDVSVGLTIEGGIDIKAVIDATQNSAIFPSVPFSWKSGSANYTFGLEGKLATALGKGYIGSIATGLYFKVGADLAYPSPVLRGVSVHAKAYISGNIAWWKIPSNAKYEATWMLYKADDGNTRAVPVITRSVMLPMTRSSTDIEVDREWKDTERFIGSKDKLVEDTSPYTYPNLAVAPDGSAKILTVRDNVNKELPSSLGIGSYDLDGTWSEGPWLSDDGYSSYAPTMAFDTNGNGLAVWCAYKDKDLTTEKSPFIAGSKVEIRSATYDGSSWSDPTWITSNNVQELEPVLRYDPSGKFVLCWTEDRDLNPMTSVDRRIRVAEFISEAVGWRSIEPIEDSPKTFDMDASMGRILVSYIKGDSIYSVTYTDGTWASPLFVSSTTGDLVRCKLTTEGGIVAWAGANIGLNYTFVDSTIVGTQMQATSDDVRAFGMDLNGLDQPAFVWIQQVEEIAQIKVGNGESLVNVTTEVQSASLLIDGETGTVHYAIAGNDDGLVDLYAGEISSEIEEEEIITSGDLELSQMDVSDSTPMEGDEIKITSTAKVTGITEVEAITVSLKVDDNEVATQALDLDGELEFSFIWIATEGDHTLELVIDSSDLVKETDETNNQITSTVKVSVYTGPTSTIGNTTFPDETDDGKDEETQEDLNIIILVVVGIIVFLVIIVVIFLVVKRSGGQREEDFVEEEESMNDEEDLEESEEDLEQEEEEEEPSEEVEPELEEDESSDEEPDESIEPEESVEETEIDQEDIESEEIPDDDNKQKEDLQQEETPEKEKPRKKKSDSKKRSNKKKGKKGKGKGKKKK